MKRYRTEDPKIQHELDIALGYHVRAGNEKGINRCLWAGADAHTPAPNPELGLSEDADTKDGEERFAGWSAIEEAASEGHLTILTRLGPDPTRDDFDDLYRYAKYGSIIAFLSIIQPPRDLTLILSWHLHWIGSPSPGLPMWEPEPLKHSFLIGFGGRRRILNELPKFGDRP
jgi:hypothetical protein